VHRMASNRILKQALAWFPENRKRKCGRPRKSEDPMNIEMTWDDYGDSADDRSL